MIFGVLIKPNSNTKLEIGTPCDRFVRRGPVSMPSVDWGWWRGLLLVSVVLSSFMLKGVRLNMTEQLIFYAAYHTNFYNQIIHLVCVPLIWWVVSSFVR